MGILEWQKKNRKATKNEICNRNADRQGYVEKHFSGCVARKLKQKIKFLPATLRI